MRTLVSKCHSIDLHSQKSEERDLLLMLFGYRFFHSRHIANIEAEKQQKEEQVKETKAKLHLKQKIGTFILDLENCGRHDSGYYRTCLTHWIFERRGLRRPPSAFPTPLRDSCHTWVHGFLCLLSCLFI